MVRINSSIPASEIAFGYRDTLHNPVVFGAGNTRSGLGPQSVLNAEITAMLWNLGTMDGEIYTTGNGPVGSDFADGDTEAFRMAQMIIELTEPDQKAGLAINTEPYAHDTLGSIWNLAAHVEENGIETMTFLGAQYHVDRAKVMGNAVFGKSKVEIVPVYTCEVTSKLSIVKEIGTTLLYAYLTKSEHEQSEFDLAKAHRKYRRIVAVPKKAVTFLQNRQDTAGLRYSTAS